MTVRVTEWQPYGASTFTDKRVQYRRSERGGRVAYGVRSYHGVVTRQILTEDDTGKVLRRVTQYDNCGCAHRKPGPAKKCAAWLARRLNKGVVPNTDKNVAQYERLVTRKEPT